MNSNGSQLSSSVADAWLEGKLWTLLEQVEAGTSQYINAEVRNGIVYLSGQVDSVKDRQELIEMAWSIAGVREVVCMIDRDHSRLRENVTLTHGHSIGASQKSWRVPAAINTWMLMNTDVDMRAIEIRELPGGVHLTGVVKNYTERELLQRVARHHAISGVVQNHLEVRSQV